MRVLAKELAGLQTKDAFVRRPDRLLPVRQQEVRHRHHAVRRGLFEPVVDPSRDAEPAFARDQRPVRLPDPDVDLGNPATQLRHQVSLGRQLLRVDERAIVALDGRLILVAVEGEVAQVLERDDLLALETVLLGFRESSPHLRVRLGEVAGNS